jgi:hypothetical protein
MAPYDAYWRDRYAIVRDPYGHHWSIATPREDLSVPELEERGDAWSALHATESGPSVESPRGAGEHLIGP